VGGAVAADAGEVDRGAEAAALPRPAHRVAGLVGDRADPELPAAIPEHLRHERHPVDAPLFVERGQDFFLAADFHQVAGAEP